MVDPLYSPGVMVREVKRSSFDDTLERIHDMGFESVQLNLNVLGYATVPESLPPGKPGEIGASFWAYGLSLAGVSGTFNTAHPDESVRAAGSRGIKTLCECVEKMGTRVITLSTGTRHPDDLWKSHPDNSSNDAWTAMSATIKSMIKAAEANSVYLAIKPESTNVVDTVDKTVRLIDQVGSDNLKVVLDPSTLLTPDTIDVQTDVYNDAFSRLGDRIALVHVRDISGIDEAAGEFRWSPVGKGRVDFLAFFRSLKQAGYQGPVILHGLAEADMPAAHDALKELLIKA